MTLTVPDSHNVPSPDITLSLSVATVYSPPVYISLLPGASCQHDLHQFVFSLHLDLWLVDSSKSATSGNFVDIFLLNSNSAGLLPVIMFGVE